MKKLFILCALLSVPAVSFAYDFGNSGADNLREQKERQYQEMKKDMQNFRNSQARQYQYQQSKTPSIQRNSSSGDNYNYSNATNQYTGTMVQPLR